MSLNTLSGPDSRDWSVRDPADRTRVSAWFCQTLSEVPACYLGITRGRVRTFYLPVLPLYGFTKLYTNPFLIIYLLPNFKLPVLVLFWGLEQKKTKSVFPQVSAPELRQNGGLGFDPPHQLTPRPFEPGMAPQISQICGALQQAPFPLVSFTTLVLGAQVLNLCPP
jgi:hypothetical protein